jgi:hypothetical protein
MLGDIWGIDQTNTYYEVSWVFRWAIERLKMW